MPWEWKDDPNTPPVQPPVYQKPYASVGELHTLTWLAVIFSVLITIAFGLLVGFANQYTYTTSDDGLTVYYSVATSGGYTAGIVLMVVGSIASLVIGIIMLVRNWPPVIAQERGMIIAMGVICILTSLIFVGIILGLVLLSKLSAYRHGPKQWVAPSPPPPPIA